MNKIQKHIQISSGVLLNNSLLLSFLNWIIFSFSQVWKTFISNKKNTHFFKIQKKEENVS
jgi:hypothetical protein